MNRIVLLFQIYHDGFQAILEPPGSYCAYANLYITLCLLKIFNFATQTFEEQFRHISILQKLSIKLMSYSTSFSNLQALEGYEEEQRVNSLLHYIKY